MDGVQLIGKITSEQTVEESEELTTRTEVEQCSRQRNSHSKGPEAEHAGHPSEAAGRLGLGQSEHGEAGGEEAGEKQSVPARVNKS